MNKNKNAGPLAGLKVVEMAGIGPAPFCAMLLADLGADVVRVARPGQKDPLGMPEKFAILFRGRPSVEIDLRDPDGAAHLWRLIDKADALVEGFRPGVMERLGFGPDAAFARNPKLVYGRMTGWGQEGPYAKLSGHDLNYLSLTGAVGCIGPEDGPPVPPLNLAADFGGGGMYLAFGLMAALRHADQTGRGQVVDAAMVDGAALLMALSYGMAGAGLMDRGRGRTILAGGAPHYGCYETSDGRHVSVCPLEPQFYAEFLDRLGLTDDPLFANRNDTARWEEMKTALAALFRTRTRAEWCEIFEGSDACFAPVLDLDEIMDHPHNAARNAYYEIDGALHAAPGPRFSETPAAPAEAVDAAPVPVTDIIGRWEGA